MSRNIGNDPVLGVETAARRLRPSGVRVAGGRLAGRRRPVRPRGVPARPAAARRAMHQCEGGNARLPRPLRLRSRAWGWPPGAASPGAPEPQQRGGRRAWPGPGEAGWGWGAGSAPADGPVGAWGSAPLRSSPLRPRGRGCDAPCPREPAQRPWRVAPVSHVGSATLRVVPRGEPL